MYSVNSSSRKLLTQTSWKNRRVNDHLKETKVSDSSFGLIMVSKSCYSCWELLEMSHLTVVGKNKQEGIQYTWTAFPKKKREGCLPRQIWQLVSEDDVGVGRWLHSTSQDRIHHFSLLFQHLDASPPPPPPIINLFKTSKI